MIITCKPHGVNLIGATEFRNAMPCQQAPESARCVPDPFLLLGVGSLGTRLGLVHIERFLGHTGCSMSCDHHDNASFWHMATHQWLSCAAIVGYRHCDIGWSIEIIVIDDRCWLLNSRPIEITEIIHYDLSWFGVPELKSCRY